MTIQLWKNFRQILLHYFSTQIMHKDLQMMNVEASSAELDTLALGALPKRRRL